MHKQPLAENEETPDTAPDAAPDAALTSKLADLRQTLETLLQRIEIGEDITEPLERVDALSQALASTQTPKMLLHYLERKSYTKALAFLS